MKRYKPKKHCNVVELYCQTVDIQSPHSAACVSIVLPGNFWEQIGQETQEDLESSVQLEACDSISDLKQVTLAISWYEGEADFRPMHLFL